MNIHNTNTLCILIKPKNASVSPCLYVQIQLFAGLLLDYLLKTAYILANFGIRECIILQVATDETVVGRHVDKSMPGEVEEDCLLLAALLASLGLADSGCNRMTTFGSGNDTLCAGEEYSCIKCLQLRDVNTMHHLVADKLTDNTACSVVTQAAGMDVGWFEIMT